MYNPSTFQILIESRHDPGCSCWFRFENVEARVGAVAAPNNTRMDITHNERCMKITAVPTTTTHVFDCGRTIEGR